MSDLDTAERRVPGKFWYAVGAILFLGSLLVPAPFVLWNLFSDNDLVTRLIAPQSKTLQLDRGKYTVFSDSRAVIDGEIIISQGSISGLRVSVRSARGEEIPVEAVRVASRYNYGGQTGFAVLEFSIPEAGAYTVTAEYREKPANRRALLSIRKEFLGGLVGSILTAVAASLAGAFLGVWIFLRTLWRRSPLHGIKQKFRFVHVNPKQAQAPRAQKYSPPGSAETKSPVEHQYDRDK